MRRIHLISLALLLLNGCGKKEEEQKGRKQSVQEVAKEMQSLQMEPGQWEATSEILQATSPGLPADALKPMEGEKKKVSNCVTPEQAARPSANFLAAQQNMNCTYQDFSMEGGRITGTMNCSGGQVPGQMVLKMDGEYGPRSYAINMDMKAGGMPGGMTMTIKAKTIGRRVGDCTAEGAAK